MEETRYAQQWLDLAFRFEPPRDNSWMVGQAEVMGESALLGLLPACPSFAQNWVGRCRVESKAISPRRTSDPGSLPVNPLERP
jgi:hypothetical protein